MKQGWEIKKLGEVFDLQMGKTPSRDNGDYWGGDNVWVAISDLQDKYIGESKEHITDKALTETKIKKVKAGTTIMSFKLSVGRAAITTQDLYTNEAIMAFNLNEGYDLIADYIYYYLKGYKWQGANKAVMGLTLNKASISQNHIAIPPREEQERIVAELDCLSGVIERKREQLQQLDALAQSIFYQMFGDPITNEKGWETSQFDNACELITDFVAAGSFADIKHNVKYIDRPDFAQLIRTTDIKNQFTKSDYVYVSESAFNYLWRVKLDKESIILPNVGVNCGEVYYITPTMLPYKNNVLGPNAILVRSNKENNRYLSFLFKTSYFQYQLRTIVNAVGQPKFNKTELKQLSVILPPLTLQQEFADKIEAIEKQKELIKQSITQTEELFNSRMSYYFN